MPLLSPPASVFSDDAYSVTCKSREKEKRAKGVFCSRVRSSKPSVCAPFHEQKNRNKTTHNEQSQDENNYHYLFVCSAYDAVRLSVDKHSQIQDTSLAAPKSALERASRSEGTRPCSCFWKKHRNGKVVKHAVQTKQSIRSLQQSALSDV